MNMEKDIKELLDGIAEELKGHKKAGKWTEDIKFKLAELGQKQGCLTAASIANADYGEWLYDLMWWKHKGDNWNDMQSIELAVESEWSGDIIELENDFLKLVYAKARLKLFIFGADTQDGYQDKLNRLKELANLCEDKNDDRYLISCTIKANDEKFIHEPFIAE